MGIIFWKIKANRGCDSCFHNRASCYHKMGLITVHLTFPQLLNIFKNNCGNVRCTAITPFSDNGTPCYENGNHSCCWSNTIYQILNSSSFQLWWGASWVQIAVKKHFKDSQNILQSKIILWCTIPRTSELLMFWGLYCEWLKGDVVDTKLIFFLSISVNFWPMSKFFFPLKDYGNRQ